MPKNGRVGRGGASAAPAISRHDEFYLTDEMTVFQNRLFRVHRHYLAKNSPIFSSMFSLPRIPSEPGATTVEGASDENPIYLSGVTELEFETLLRYFYNMHDGSSQPRSSWITLLSIAHRYEFLNVRERAIREIYDPQGNLDKGKSGSNLVPDSEPPDNLTLILMAEKYDVPLQQALPCFVDLVMRKETLSEIEITRLSATTLHRLARAREEYLRSKQSTYNFLGPRQVAEGIVSSIWKAGKK